MYKFHIGKNGEPARCRALIKCRLGGEHFESKENAMKSIEEKLAENNSVIPKVEKKSQVSSENKEKTFDEKDKNVFHVKLKSFDNDIEKMKNERKIAVIHRDALMKKEINGENEAVQQKERHKEKVSFYNKTISDKNKSIKVLEILKKEYIRDNQDIYHEIQKESVKSRESVAREGIKYGPINTNHRPTVF